MPRQPYPSDLTPDQWRRLQPWLPAPKTQGRPRFPRLQHLWADAGYAGPRLGDWVRETTDWTLAIVRRDEPGAGFQVLPRRWVVERTFAWLGRYRRLSKDYEGLPETSETWIRIAMTDRMLHRLGSA